jgi:hypothetical protein
MRILWLRNFALATTLIGLTACAQSAPAQPDTVSTSAPISSKLSPRLQAAAQQLMAGRSPMEFQSGLVRADSQGRLQVYVYIDDFAPANLSALITHGLVDAMPSPSLLLVQGWVKPQDLDVIASLAFVSRITPPHYAQTR